MNTFSYIFIKLFLLIIFSPLIISAYNKNQNPIFCGGISVASMKRINFTSIFGSVKKSVKIAEEPFDSGQYGEVVIGFFGHEIGKCVAVKMVDPEKGFDELINGVKVLRKVREKLPISRRKHIIEIFDAGSFIERKWLLISKKKALLIMELGTDNLLKRMYAGGNIYGDDEQMLEFARQLVQPLGELHEVALHLDIKPGNYIYVESETGQQDNVKDEVLKLIDFDGAELLEDIDARYDNETVSSDNGESESTSTNISGISSYDDNDGIGVNGGIDDNPNNFRANQRILPKRKFNARMYASPEMFARNRVSPKADIWAVGMILYEVFFISQLYDSHKFESQKEFRRTIFPKMRSIWSLYHGQNVDDETKVWTPIFGDKNEEEEAEEFDTNVPRWFETFQRPIVDILHIWNLYPRTALLITNLLNVRRQKRMSAIGVIDFLDGKCFPRELERRSKIKMFHGITARELGALIEAKTKQARGGYSPEGTVADPNALAKMEIMRKLLEGAIDRRRELRKIFKRPGIRRHCDTKMTSKDP